MREHITIDGENYTLLGLQKSGTGVYRGRSAYVRLGSPDVIAKDLALHREMEKQKFPVSPLLSEGEFESQAYFAEKPLGEKSFRARFQETYERTGSLDEHDVRECAAVLKKLYSAQLKNTRDWDPEEFAHGIRLAQLCTELPQHADALRARFALALERLRKLPGVLTHGDCNPSNMYEGGVIDLEDSFYGPLGYDVVSAVYSIEWSPLTRDYEFYAQYRFTDEEKDVFMKAIDVLSKKHSSPGLLPFIGDLQFCRVVWLCSGMGEWPRTQQWRFEKFVKSYLHE